MHGRWCNTIPMCCCHISETNRSFDNEAIYIFLMYGVGKDVSIELGGQTYRYNGIVWRQVNKYGKLLVRYPFVCNFHFFYVLIRIFVCNQFIPQLELFNYDGSELFSIVLYPCSYVQTNFNFFTSGSNCFFVKSGSLSKQ